MFTGLIEEVGKLISLEPLENGRRLEIGAPRIAAELAAGDSVAVDGVCLTVVEPAEASFAVEVIGTTAGRTTLPEFEVGRRVNLEQALALGERLGGHLVQGHVDGLGTVEAIRRENAHVLIEVSLPDVVSEVTVLHGSLAINGVSMTVNALPAPDRAEVAVIPHTWRHTTFSALRVGAHVNLEGDMLGRFVVHHLKQIGPPRV